MRSLKAFLRRGERKQEQCAEQLSPNSMNTYLSLVQRLFWRNTYSGEYSFKDLSMKKKMQGQSENGKHLLKWFLTD